MRRFISLAALLAVLGAAGPVDAGPPCLCWPFETDQQVPLEEASDLEPSQVVDTVLQHLKPETPVFNRMEILRRAALRLGGDTSARDALLTRLMQRALDGEAVGSPGARAWFDAAFAQSAFHQMGSTHLGNGYAWMKRAIVLSDQDPRMHFAAAVIALDAQGDVDAHQAVAERAEAKDALLARNLEMFRRNAVRDRAPTAK